MPRPVPLTRQGGESGTVSRLVHAVVFTLPMFAAMVIAAFGGEWSRELWPPWLWVGIGLGAATLLVLLKMAGRAYILECERQPNLCLVFKPGHRDYWAKTTLTGSGEEAFFLRVSVFNRSSLAIKDCEVKLIRLVYDPFGEKKEVISDQNDLLWSGEGKKKNTVYPGIPSFVDVIKFKHGREPNIRMQPYPNRYVGAMNETGKYSLTVAVVSPEGAFNQATLLIDWSGDWSDVVVKLA